jgi:hypothetical protein
MDTNCWMDGRSVGGENLLWCDWLTQFMQFILLVSHWSESVLLMPDRRQCSSVHSLVDSTSVQMIEAELVHHES